MKNYDPLVDPLLTDLYQLTMAYGYWRSGTHQKPAVFDLFFRKCPFGGEFAIFAGLEQVLAFVANYRITRHHTDYLKSLPEFEGKEAAFFAWLESLDCSAITIRAPQEGSLVFPRVPLLQIEGPLALVQLLETTLLSLVNYASLVATNAARYRLAAGWDKSLLEFGLRRAQGPDGGVSASLYSYMGGFDATSNVKAGELFGLPIAGTHAHAFVESFTSISELAGIARKLDRGQPESFCKKVLAYRDQLGFGQTNEGELAAFIAYAAAFPDRFTALVDTYNSLESGVPNFICVAAALFGLGYQARGIRLDSGDLAFLSRETRKLFQVASQQTGFDFDSCKITASNDINESILRALRSQEHAIDNFGIGTNLVTCETQPAFGGVFKLVEINGKARVKLSENSIKITIPGKKRAFRLMGGDGLALVDLLCTADEPAPQVGQPVLCRHPFDPYKRVNVVPSAVIDLLPLAWEGRRSQTYPGPQAIRASVQHSLQHVLRPDQQRSENPSIYKVSLSQQLFTAMQSLIEQETIVKTIGD